MIGTEHLTFERVGATAIVTMNRPEAKNALSGPMLVGMADAWVEIDSNDDIRCAILTGAGGTFCAGMDLKSMSGPGNESVRQRMAEVYASVVEAEITGQCTAQEADALVELSNRFDAPSSARMWDERSKMLRRFNTDTQRSRAPAALAE